MRPVPAQRLCALGAALLLGLALSTVPGSAAAKESSSLSAQVAALNADIDRVSAELAEGAVAYEAAAQELVRLTQEQFAAGADHDALRDAATTSRSALAGLARSAYKGGMPPVVTALMSGDPRALSDLAYVQRSVNRIGASRGELARDLDAQRAGAGLALEQSAELRRAALAQRQALDGQVRELAAKADRLTAELAATAARLQEVRAAEQARALLARQSEVLAEMRAAEQRRAAVAAAAGLTFVPGLGATTGGGGCQLAGPAGEANGFLSDAGLCPLEVGGGHRLRTDASQAFNALSRARLAATGSPLCVTDSYRSYPEQVDVFKRKPALAATPGRSQHGWGMAVDLCGGVQRFGSEAHQWMQVNAPRYGWIHPTWARQGGSRPEAWHWEYVGG